MGDYRFWSNSLTLNENWRENLRKKGIAVIKWEGAMKKRLLFLNMILVLGIYGCSAGTVLLRNDMGDTVKCEGSSDSVNACIKKYEATGYKRFEEPEMKMPMGGSSY